MAQPTSESWNPQWKERTNCLQSGPLTPHVHIPIFIHISYTHTTIKYKVGVKRSLSDQEHLLFLYKTWLLLPAPTQQLTTIYNLSSGLLSSSAADDISPHSLYCVCWRNWQGFRHLCSAGCIPVVQLNVHLPSVSEKHGSGSYSTHQIMVVLSGKPS